MRITSLKRWLIAAASLVALTGTAQVLANEGLEKLMKDPNYWVTPSGDYWNWRYSKLDQINSTNAQKLQAAWTFSTGVLRGHEGGPLVLPAAAKLTLARDEASRFVFSVKEQS